MLLMTVTLASDCGALCSGEAFQAYGILLAAGKFGAAREEQGAFLVVRADGRIALRRWQSQEPYAATYYGRIPAGVLAVVHTHPYWSAEPSEHDRAEAKRIRLPIIVVTRDAVTVANADGTSNRLVTGRWSGVRP